MGQRRSRYAFKSSWEGDGTCWELTDGPLASRTLGTREPLLLDFVFGRSSLIFSTSLSSHTIPFISDEARKILDDYLVGTCDEVSSPFRSPSQTRPTTWRCFSPLFLDI